MDTSIVKDNKLIQASFNFSLAEQRLILLAIIEARNTGKGIDDKTLLSIHASMYADYFDVDSKTAYRVLKAASKTLKGKDYKFMAISPKTGKLIPFFDPWLNRVGYEKDSGYIHIRFSEEVVPLITQLGENFTQYEIQKIVKLTSSYAIRLYELLIQWKSIGVTQKFTIDDLREKLGVEPEQYKELYNLKARVIDLAIKQINQHTDLRASYIQHKDGKTVTALTFSFKFKKPTTVKDVKTDKKPLDVTKLSQKQLERIARNKQFIADYNSMVSPSSPAGQTEQGWVYEMVNRLKNNPNQFNKKSLKNYLD